MSGLRKAITYFWIYVEKPIWSFIVNFMFWITSFSKLKETKKAMDDMKNFPLEFVMGKFTWVEDFFKDWTPWASTVVCRGMRDDCDGAAALAKWWFKQQGIKADILNLYNEKEGHTICVTKDRTKMVSNKNVIELHPDTWKDDMLAYFGGVYTVII